MQPTKEFLKPEAISSIAVKSSHYVWLAILVIGGFYLLTIRQGHNWGDDFSMYIQHARNIVAGEKYNTTGHIYLPPYIGPDSYPPVYPLMLAPVLWLFGESLTAMKVELALLFMLALFLLVKCVKDVLPVNWQVVLVALVGLNPYFWTQKDNVRSEIPFFAATFLSIYLVRKSYEAFESGATGKVKLGYVLATGVSFYLAYGTRSIGLVLLPSLVLYDLIRRRKWFVPSWYVVGVAAVLFALVAVQYVLLRSDRAYAEIVMVESGSFLRDWMRFILLNVPRYLSSLTQIWDNGYSEWPRIGLTLAMTGLAAVGFLAQVVKKITFIELFVLLYTVSVLIVPMDGGVRYLLPVVPFYIFYSLQGLRALPEWKGFQKLAIGSVAVAVLATYAVGFTRYDMEEIPNGVTSKEAVEFFDYVKRQTAENDVIIFTKPRALALYTGRKTSFYPMLMDDEEMWAYFQRIGATHIVLGPKGVEPYDQEFLSGFLNRHRGLLQEEYSNAAFTVYRITSLPKREQLSRSEVNSSGEHK